MGFEAILGGALTGLGQGIAQKGQLDWQQQFDAAREGLRHQNTLSEETNTADLQDRNAAKATTRGTQATMAVNAQQGTIQQQRDAQQNNYQRSNAILQNALTIDQQNNSSKNQGEIIRLQDQLKSGDINQILVDGSGNYQVVHNDGTVTPANITAAPKDYTGSSKAGGTAGLDFGSGGGTSAPGAAGSVPNFTGKAAAEAFMNAPGNAGKPFLFNGQPKRVPK